MVWTRTQVEKLISFVSEMPHFFNPRHHLYKYKWKRNLALKEIAAKMSQVRPNTSPEECCRKWRMIRICYRAERRKVLGAKKRGADVDQLYVPTLYYYKSLSFLEDSVTAIKSTSTLDDEEDPVTARVSTSSLDNEEAGPSPVYRSYFNNPALDEALLNLVDAAKACMTRSEDDSVEIYAEYLACMLRKITDEDKKSRVKFAIVKMLYEYMYSIN